ncbi:PssD/Cps14F family polysaccharide biosynthesis glycosyltransferase [Photobacterium phosphoreum]|uniref:PssD/Cps14F family polysaccharide biosynthesis glycosyltransferase n=1 Tax=Photobacterium phosphoreum TaxID=659 RepID=UPI001E4F2EE7|nr:PssD/Cps14F family polysaccharide biosynthesis glycosyltransferase [Photobacterium phosphoreum]MCD9470821.1 hypothetical protein [Photobacterium phosphoreum]
MKLNREKVFLILNGVGGHKSEMISFIDSFILDENKYSKLNYIQMGSPIDNVNFIDSYPLVDIRHKTSNTKSILMAIKSVFMVINNIINITKKFDVEVVITTGPGICILPSFILKYLFKTKIIYFESSCMFYSKTFTGKVMYKIADLFLIQNKSLLKIYPKSNFVGRL